MQFAAWSAVAVTPVGKAPFTALSQLIVAGVVHGTPGDCFAGSGAELDDDEGAFDAGAPAPTEMPDGEESPMPSNVGPVTTPAVTTPASAVVPAANAPWRCRAARRPRKASLSTSGKTGGSLVEPERNAAANASRANCSSFIGVVLPSGVLARVARGVSRGRGRFGF